MAGLEPCELDLRQVADLDDDALRSAFRRFLADLAGAAQRRPLPLEGVNPQSLLAFVERSFACDLFADLSWLSGESAASALYELWFALSPCEARSALYALLIERLRDGDLACFVVLGRAFVQSGEDILQTPAIRARVSLALSLPIRAGSAVDSLALALVSEPRHARTWVDEASRGSLPSRRLAARLIERAAREAGRRFEQGDDAGLRALEVDVVREAIKRLLADREALVWRHVAVARGLLSAAAEELAREIDAHLAPELTPTEWRRAACSLSASIAVRPEALARTEQLIKSSLMRREPGIAGCLISGLLRVAELDEPAAERLLPELVRVGGVPAAEAFLDLLDEGMSASFACDARAEVERCLSVQLAEPRVMADDGAYGFADWLLARLRGREGALSLTLRASLASFESEGALRASHAAQPSLSLVQNALAELRHEALDDRASRLRVVTTLSELDRGLLQTSTLADLAMLYEDGATSRGLSRVFEQLADWLAQKENAADVEGSAHPALRMQRVRTLIHAVDAQGSYGDTLAAERRPRRLRVTRVLLGRVRKESGTALSRAIAACLSRAFDALVREQVFELSDVVLCTALYVGDAAQIRTLAEASMLPEAASALDHLASLLDPAHDELRTPQACVHALDELRALAFALPAALATRVSALRWALTRLHASLHTLNQASSFAELTDEGRARGALHSLREASSALAHLVGGTRRRLNPAAQLGDYTLGGQLATFVTELEALAARDDRALLELALSAVCDGLATELPGPLARIVRTVLERVVTLPRDELPERLRERRESLPMAAVQKLPMWLPQSRLLGGFYVFHTLGEGGGGSVFAARRAEERHDESAEVFALKVPEYTGHVAHLLSEADFLRMFREEAGALLALPDSHPNLARFVTFDAGVKPKPTLVMEHVEGPSLEKLIARRHVDAQQARLILQGVVSGLCAMHKMGIAHLDLKPGNVIVRGFWSGNTTPVLVDFGLSGRRLRPGCGTPCYSAPEVWGAFDAPDPRPADVYAFGCLAFEVLTGRSLFADGTPSMLLSAHVSHDGVPEALAPFAGDAELAPLVALLTACLRRDPTQRITLLEVEQRLAAACAPLAQRPWPLAPLRRQPRESPQATATSSR